MSQTLPKVNTHIHLPPNFSAFNSVHEALDQAANEGIEILGASNYYDFSVYEPFASEAIKRGIQPLFGIEIVCRIADLAERGVKINDPGNPGKMYICGKSLRSFEQPTQRAEAILDTIRSGDERRIEQMVDLMKSHFDKCSVEVELDATSIVEGVARMFGAPKSTVVLQERHVAQAFQKAFFAVVKVETRQEKLATLFGVPSKVSPTDAVGIQAEIRTHLMKAGKPAFVNERFVTYDEARELIIELGGFVCYPVLADGMSPLSEFESDPFELAEKLIELGIDAAEFIPNRNRPEVLARYVEALASRGFALSAGTEHNTTERIPIEPVCKGGVPIPVEIRAQFYEGALRQVELQKR